MDTFCLLAMGRIRVALILAWVLGLGGVAAGDDVANPSTRASPSGVYVLSIEPHAPDGSGFADYRLVRDGEEVWAGERPFSLWDAEVTDDGVVVGYAYEKGVLAGGNHGTSYRGLAVYILAAEGTTSLRDSVTDDKAWVPAPGWSGSDSAAALGLVVHPALDRLAVRFDAGFQVGGEIWRCFRLSTAERIADLTPKYPSAADEFERCVAAVALPGTPLTLMHWYVERRLGAERTQGASVVVVDGDGKIIWRLELPGEYDGIKENWSWYRDLLSPGIVQASVVDGGFSFRSRSLGTETTFAVAPSADEASGWEIRQVKRAEIGSLFAPIEIESIDLKPAGKITLRGPRGAATPIGGILDFEIDEAGNIGWVRQAEGDTLRFVLVDGAGAVQCDMELGIPRDAVWSVPSASPVGGGRWLVHQRYIRTADKSGAWLVDPATLSVRPLEGFPASQLLVAAHGGGFVTISIGSARSGGSSSVFRWYDRNGQLAREAAGSGIGSTGPVQGAASLSDGRIVALLGISNTLEFFDANGMHLESKALSDAAGPGFLYPTAVWPDHEGGFTLHVFQGEPPIYRVDSKGAVSARLAPRFENGQTFSLHGAVQIAPDGSAWTSDGNALLRLDKNGVVDRVLGPEPEDEGLEQITGLTVGSGGKIYAINRRNAAVHVFDATGEQVGLFKPEPGDWPTMLGIGHVAVAGDGSVYYQPGVIPGLTGQGGYLAFTAEGERIGFETSGLTRIREEWAFQPGSNRRWVLGYKSLHLVGEDGKEIRPIGRRADGDWLEVVEGGSVAPNGSFACLTGPSSLSRDAEVSIYDREGEPIGVVPLVGGEGRSARIAFDGKTLVTIGRGAIYLYDLQGGVRRFVPPVENPERAFWYAFFSPDGGELWLHESQSLEVLRFTLPER